MGTNCCYHLSLPISCHIDYSHKTMMPCDMLISFAFTSWFMWLNNYRCSQRKQQSFFSPIKKDAMCFNDW